MFGKKNIILIAALFLCLPMMAGARDNADTQDNIIEQDNAPQRDSISVVAKSRHIKRFDVQADRKVFIPKGNVMFGGFVGYNSLQGDNLNFLILKDISMRGYTLNAAPYIGGFVADNFAIGARLKYTRYMAGLDNLDLSLGSDLNIKLQDLYAFSHTYEGDIFGRYYMPFGNSKWFGMFAEFRMTYKRSQGKNTTGTGKDLDGTYQMGHTAGFYINPGLSIFVCDFVAAELGIGVLGLDYTWKDTVTNQVETGSYKSAGANLRLNLLSVNIGITFFL